MKIIVDLCNQHFGELSELKRMTLNAFTAGADAVKIQLLDSEKLLGVTDKKYRDVSYDDALELSRYCESIGVEFMASVFDEERFEWLRDFNIKTHKIASRTSKLDRVLSEKMLSDNKPTLISTGMHKFGQFPYGKDENIDYLFCVSKYPTFLDDEDLAKMPYFKKGAYSGYSDHTLGIAAPIRAYMRGAKFLEKHFSNNLFAQSRTEGAHLCSFNHESLTTYTRLVKNLEIMENCSEFKP